MRQNTHRISWSVEHVETQLTETMAGAHERCEEHSGLTTGSAPSQLSTPGVRSSVWSPSGALADPALAAPMPEAAEWSYATNTGMDTPRLPGRLDGSAKNTPGEIRSPHPFPLPAPVIEMVDNHARDIHGTSIQAGVIHGPITVNSPSAVPVPVPGWVGTALPVHQCDAGELGAHNSIPGPEDAGLPPYVARDVDAELDQRLAAAAAAPRGGLVLVTGASTAGKTRALAAALGRTLPDRMLVAPPEDADLRPLPTWLKDGSVRAPQGWVIWLDDLDRHLSSSGLTPALVAELGVAGAVVAATIRRNQLEALRPSGTDDHRTQAWAGYAVLKTAPVVVERRWSGQERERARASGDERLTRAAADERFGVAEQLAAGPVLEPIWRSGADSGHPRGFALVAAAVALAQIGVSSPLTREQIETAHGAYLPDPPPLPEEADQAWEWATRQRSGLAGLLVPVDHEGRLRAFDYLTLQGMPPETVWRAALDIATEQERIAVGVTAQSAGQIDIAEAALRPLAYQGHLDGMYYYADLTSQRGSGKWKWEAIEWLEKAAKRGHVEAMVALGDLLSLQDWMESWAEDWYLQAIDHGHPDAMCELADLLSEEPGREKEAESYYRRAIEQGDTYAVEGLGYLLKRSGRPEEAEHWFLRAAEQGHEHAMEELARLLSEKPGREEEAATWYQRARERAAATRARFASMQWWLDPGP